VSLQAQIEMQATTIAALTSDVGQLEQVRASQDALLLSLEQGNQQLRARLEEEQQARRRADAAGEVRAWRRRVQGAGTHGRLC
jgi:peptidoglycan hydrolase CwlO-like protein